jgi:hypothetical protein
MVQILIPEASDQKGIIADFKARGRKKMEGRWHEAQLMPSFRNVYP